MTEVLRNTAKSKYLTISNQYLRMLHVCTNGRMVVLLSGYKTLIRNFYETSHAKGPQDAAGGFLKNQACIAVIRRKTKIQCAKDFYNFCTDNLQNPKSGMYNCRIFKYIETIPRYELVNYKTVAENRKIHQIVSKEDSPGKLVTSSLEIIN